MNYTHYKLGTLPKDCAVEVSLNGSAANVYLIDDENLIKYKREQEFDSIGGFTKDNLVRHHTTHDDRWHIIVELTNPYGEVRTSYRIIKHIKKAANDLMYAEPKGGFAADKPREIFVAYAARDIADVAQPLVFALSAIKDINVWHFEINKAYDLRQTVSRELQRNGRGVLILSASLTARAKSDSSLADTIKEIIPQVIVVSHNITQADITEYNVRSQMSTVLLPISDIAAQIVSG